MKGPEIHFPITVETSNNESRRKKAEQKWAEQHGEADESDGEAEAQP